MYIVERKDKRGRTTHYRKVNGKFFRIAHFDILKAIKKGTPVIIKIY